MTRPRQQEQELGDSHRRAIDHVPWVESIREGCWAATRATAPVNLLEASILMKRTMGQMDGWRRAVVWMKFEGRGIGAGRNEFVWLEGDEGAGFPQAGGGSLVLLAAQEQQERATSRSPPGPALGSSGEITRWRRKGLSATMTDQSSPLRPRCNGAGGLTRAPCPCLFCRDLGEMGNLWTRLGKAARAMASALHRGSSDSSIESNLLSTSRRRATMPQARRTTSWQKICSRMTGGRAVRVVSVSLSPAAPSRPCLVGCVTVCVTKRGRGCIEQELGSQSDQHGQSASLLHVPHPCSEPFCRCHPSPAG